MIEIEVINYLNERIDVECSYEKTTEDSYILLELMSQTRENFLYTSTFRIVSYANTKLNASKLNEQVKSIMHSFSTQSNISSSYFANASEYTDTSTKKHAYQCIYEIYHF